MVAQAAILQRQGQESQFQSARKHADHTHQLKQPLSEIKIIITEMCIVQQIWHYLEAKSYGF